MEAALVDVDGTAALPITWVAFLWAISRCSDREIEVGGRGATNVELENVAAGDGTGILKGRPFDEKEVEDEAFEAVAVADA